MRFALVVAIVGRGGELGRPAEVAKYLLATVDSLAQKRYGRGSIQTVARIPPRAATSRDDHAREGGRPRRFRHLPAAIKWGGRGSNPGPTD